MVAIHRKYIGGIEDKLWLRVKVAAAKGGTTISAWIREAILSKLRRERG